MRKANHSHMLVSIIVLALALWLASCGGGVELTYLVNGEATEADVTYTNADGESEEASVSLPWEETIDAGQTFSFDLEAVDESASGALTCQVLVDGDSLGQGTGSSSVTCSGRISRKGNSLNASFSSVSDPLARQHLETGSEHLGEGRVDEAAKELEEAVRLAPDLAEAHLKLGRAYHEQGSLEEAIATYQRAIELDPEHPGARRNLGTAYGDQGRWKEALAAYEKAVELDPDFGEVYSDLTATYLELDRLPDAIAAGRKAIELVPDYAMAHNNLGLAYFRQDQLDEAKAEYEAALDLNPELAISHYNLGLVSVAQERYEEAMAEWEETIRIDPDYVMAYYNLGLAHLDQGRTGEAIAAWEETIKLVPDHADAHYNLGLAYSREGRPEDAIAAFEAYLAARPDAADREAVEQEIAKLTRQAGGAEHVNASGGYSIRHPEGWHVVENGAETSLAPSREDYEASALQSPLITLMVWPLVQASESFGLEMTADPSAFLEVLARRLEAQIDDVGNVQIGGYPAAVAATSGTLQGSSYYGDMIVIVADERLFLAEALAPPAQWDDFRPTFVDIVGSLTFFEPDG